MGNALSSTRRASSEMLISSNNNNEPLPFRRIIDHALNVFVTMVRSDVNEVGEVVMRCQQVFQSSADEIARLRQGIAEDRIRDATEYASSAIIRVLPLAQRTLEIRSRTLDDRQANVDIAAKVLDLVVVAVMMVVLMKDWLSHILRSTDAALLELRGSILDSKLATAQDLARIVDSYGQAYDLANGAFERAARMVPSYQ